jgi:thioredoxin reductase (NADPH)
MQETIEKIIIIGSGPAGLTAGIYAARAALEPLIIEGTDPGGQLMNTTLVENWPGEKSILGPELMKKMRDQAHELGCRFTSASVTQASLNTKPFELILSNNSSIKCQSLVIATGAHPRKLGCKGETTFWGKGVSTCAICDGPFFKDKQVVIVGGGDSAMESASFLMSYAKKLTIVHILDHLTASAAMQQRVLKNPKVEIIYNSTVEEITGENGKVSAVTLVNKKTGALSSLPTQGVFIAIGLIPNTALFKNQLEMKASGHLLVTNDTHTSIAGVFAAGDVADIKYRQAITSAGSGCAAALDAERYLKEHEYL